VQYYPQTDRHKVLSSARGLDDDRSPKQLLEDAESKHTAFRSSAVAATKVLVHAMATCGKANRGCSGSTPGAWKGPSLTEPLRYFGGLNLLRWVLRVSLGGAQSGA
jgi:hypothetical protein